MKVPLSISGKTKIYGIIGYPISHTFSPLLHNTAFHANQLEATYLPFSVHPDHLKEAIAGIKGLEISGINVTIPHKITVLPYLDEITPTAQRIGAVNTIRNNEGKLLGTNTDGLGFLRSLSAISFAPYQKTILLLGAGGSARSILVTLAEEQAKRIIIVNRTPEKAAQLIAEFSPIFPKIEFHMGLLQSFYEEPIDLLINATNVGMQGPLTPVDLAKFKTLHHVSDIIYTPSQTPLLKQAEQLKIPFINGIGMLLYQGCEAFEFWTQQAAPVFLMEKKLLSFLKSRE